MPYAPFRDSSAIIGDRSALRERIAEDGYLFVASLLPSEAVARVHDSIVALCRRAGWADTAGRAIGKPVLEAHEGWWDVYDPLQKLERFHGLAHRPELLSVIAAVVDGDVLVHPRNIGRVTFPGAAHFTTPPHQDYPLIQGAAQT